MEAVDARFGLSGPSYLLGPAFEASPQVIRANWLTRSIRILLLSPRCFTGLKKIFALPQFFTNFGGGEKWSDILPLENRISLICDPLSLCNFEKISAQTVCNRRSSHRHAAIRKGSEISRCFLPINCPLPPFWTFELWTSPTGELCPTFAAVSLSLCQIIHRVLRKKFSRTIHQITRPRGTQKNDSSLYHFRHLVLRRFAKVPFVSPCSIGLAAFADAAAANMMLLLLLLLQPLFVRKQKHAQPPATTRSVTSPVRLQSSYIQEAPRKGLRVAKRQSSGVRTNIDKDRRQ